MIKVSTKTSGGKRLKAIQAAQKRAMQQMANRIDVGLYATAKYPNGEAVTNVAAQNEFGDGGIPERPFLRPGSRDAMDDVKRHIKQTVDPKRAALTDTEAAQCGEIIKGTIQDTIRKVNAPPNAPATIARKGSSNPLIDTGFMRQSVTYKVS